MAQVPDKIVNKFAKFMQSLLLWAAFFAAIIGVGSITVGTGGTGWIVIAVMIGVFAASIKTTYNRTGTVSRYK